LPENDDKDAAQQRNVIPLFAQARGAPLADLAGRPRGRERLEAIFEQKNPAALVTALPVQDLYYLVREVGLDEAQGLVELATPEQIQGMLDLDTWRGDTLEVEALAPWIAALVEAGPEKLAAVWAELDPELATLWLQRWVRVYNLTEEEVPEDEEPPFFATPDRFFMVKITAEDGETARLVERTLDWLYRVDGALARHALRSAISELPSDLEEMALRWRTGRLADLGYAPFDEALEVYRPIDPGSISLDETTREEAPSDVRQELPVPLAAAATGTGFLAKVLARITDVDEARRLETALVMLLNRVLSADRVPPGDTTLAVAGTARAAATLSLGLETLARGDVDRGVTVLAHVSLVRLHRLGHTVTLQLGRLLAALGARAARLDEPWASIAVAMNGPRPAFPRLIDEPPEAGTRPITTLEDLRRATLAVTRIAAQTVLVYDLLGVTTLGDVGRTALAHLLVGEPLSAAPLSLTDLPRLAAALPGGQTDAAAQEKAARAFGELAASKQLALPPEWAVAVDGWLAGLARGVEKRGDQVVLDRRFVEGLIVS
jgi:hypothetical protein